METNFLNFKKIFLIIFVGLVVPLSAQVVQYGRVVEMNTGGKTLSGVSLSVPSVHDSWPTASDANGVFKLSFAEHQVGDVVYGLRIHKQGYEVVNHHIVRDGWTLTDRDTLRVVMASVDKLTESRARYYDLVEAACISRHESTVSFINDQFAQGLINKTELDQWLLEADRELWQSYQNMDELADRFARINNDDLSSDDARIAERLAVADMQGAIAIATEGVFFSVLEAYRGTSLQTPLENQEQSVASVIYDTALITKMMRVYELLNDKETECEKLLEELRKLLR